MTRVVVVTGGAGDIGRALCRRYLADGLTVAVLDRDAAALARAAADLGADRGRCLALPADVTDASSVEAAMRRVEAELGAIEVLVNNAGGVTSPTLSATDEAAWLTDIDLNLNGAWRCVRAVQGGMTARRRGVILNVSSANARGIYGHPAYSAAKAGLEQFTRFLAVELGPHGVRANAIAPGTVKTQAWRERAERNPEIFEQVKRWYPLRDVCVPDDVAALAAFLSGPEARMITGAVIPVDGGLTAGSVTVAREFSGADFA